MSTPDSESKGGLSYREQAQAALTVGTLEERLRVGQALLECDRFEADFASHDLFEGLVEGQGDWDTGEAPPIQPEWLQEVDRIAQQERIGDIYAALAMYVTSNEREWSERTRKQIRRVATLRKAAAEGYEAALHPGLRIAEGMADPEPLDQHRILTKAADNWWRQLQSFRTEAHAIENERTYDVVAHTEDLRMRIPQLLARNHPEIVEREAETHELVTAWMRLLEESVMENALKGRQKPSMFSSKRVTLDWNHAFNESLLNEYQSYFTMPGRMVDARVVAPVHTRCAELASALAETFTGYAEAHTDAAQEMKAQAESHARGEIPKRPFE